MSSGCSFSNKKILNELYFDGMDGIIYSIFSEIFHIYNSIINASADIALVFAPGIKRIDYLSEDELSFENFHKEQFEEIFLKDDFIKVIIFEIYFF